MENQAVHSKDMVHMGKTAEVQPEGTGKEMVVDNHMAWHENGLEEDQPAVVQQVQEQVLSLEKQWPVYVTSVIQRSRH